MIAYGNQANLNTRAELHFARRGGEAGRAQSCINQANPTALIKRPIWPS